MEINQDPVREQVANFHDWKSDFPFPSWLTPWCPLRLNPVSPWQRCLQCYTPRTTSTHFRWVWVCTTEHLFERFTSLCNLSPVHWGLSFLLRCQSVPKPPPVPPSKKRKRVVEEPPVVLAPKPLLSGAVPLEAFLTTLQKVGKLQASVAISRICTVHTVTSGNVCIPDQCLISYEGKVRVFIFCLAAWNHRGKSGGDGRRTHPAPPGRGHADPAGGGRDAHRLWQQRAAAHHTERPGAPLPAEALTPALLLTFLCFVFNTCPCFTWNIYAPCKGHLRFVK